MSDEATSADAAGEEAMIARLEARLREPDAGENGYRARERDGGRLEALRRLRERADAGEVAIEGRPGGINTHVHTSKSFSFFRSPSEAVWSAYRAGLRVFGINDHYTIAGHEEFRRACEITGILPTFSMEAVALWEEAERAGETVNDPSNPGRTYLTAKGVTRDFPPGSRGRRDLEGMNRALRERNREITARLSARVEERLGIAGALCFADVLRLTPHDQPTERHVAEAAERFLRSRFVDPKARAEAVEALCGEPAGSEMLGDPARLQSFLRAKLIKAGRPAYVPESAEAFIPIERMVSLALELGAIPTYPVLGNPVTPWEEDLEELFDRLEPLGIRAIEVIPDRNTAERLGAIVRAATERDCPVFNGTEHNTRAELPLVDRFFFEEEFRPAFERGARVLLGHQALRARGEPGYVEEDGRVAGGDRAAAVKRAEAAGAERFSRRARGD